MPLYNRLKEYRAKIKVNQTEMGNLVGVSRQTISQIERGDYSPSVLSVCLQSENLSSLALRWEGMVVAYMSEFIQSHGRNLSQN